MIKIDNELVNNVGIVFPYKDFLKKHPTGFKELVCKCGVIHIIPTNEQYERLTITLEEFKGLA